MNQKEDRAYIQGSRATWQHMLSQCIGGLMGDGASEKALEPVRLVLQLEQARAALRRVCEDHGDNDWDDDLSLADVIEKHLGRHLDG